MTDFFSASEIVQMGVEIEKNGRDFYNRVAELSPEDKVRPVFQYLAGEEEKHIKVFQDILESIEKYEPAESYPGEYFAYLKALSEEHIFTQARAGEKAAREVKTDKDAVEMGLGFEKDSILFYYEMKKFVLKGEDKIINRLIIQEQEHFNKLVWLKNNLQPGLVNV